MSAFAEDCTCEKCPKGVMKKHCMKYCEKHMDKCCPEGGTCCTEATPTVSKDEFNTRATQPQLKNKALLNTVLRAVVAATSSARY